MALNFKISNQRNSGDLYLKLIGDFDGSSAFELINTLQAQNDNVKKIIVNTDGLSSIHPFGRRVFQKNCYINKLSYELAVIGKYSAAIAPRMSCSL
jgi:hypothetical protein